MELYQIRYFLAVAETLNFTRASELSFVSQPALTKAIQRLEETVGGRLFDRGKSAVQLTEFGQSMMKSLRQVYEGYQAAVEKAGQLARERENVLRIGVSYGVDLEQVLPGFLSHSHGDGLELRFQEGDARSLLDLLDKGHADLCVVGLPMEKAKRLRGHKLFDQEYGLAVGPSHRLNGRASVALPELHGEDYCKHPSCNIDARVEQQLAEQGLRLGVVQLASRKDWSQALVKAGFGVAIMPRFVARQAGLHWLRIQDFPIHCSVGLALHTERRLPPAKQAVLEALLARDWRLPYAAGDGNPPAAPARLRMPSFGGSGADLGHLLV